MDDRGGEPRNPWTTLASEERYDNPWIRVVEHRVLNPAGKPGVYGTVHYKNLAIGVLPIDAEGHTWLVGQWRYPGGYYSWEMPEGGGRHDAEPLDTARRELAEETGLKARSWRELMRLHLSNSVSDELAIIYLAWDLEMGEAALEEDEELAVRRVPFSALLARVAAGEITDAMTVAAALRVAHEARCGRLPEPLARALEGQV
jgi:ADP-ribose pyrophosphatase